MQDTATAAVRIQRGTSRQMLTRTIALCVLISRINGVTSAQSPSENSLQSVNEDLTQKLPLTEALPGTLQVPRHVVTGHTSEHTAFGGVRGTHYSRHGHSQAASVEAMGRQLQSCTLPGTVAGTPVRLPTAGLSGSYTSTNLGTAMTAYYTYNQTFCGAQTGTRKLLIAYLDLGQVVAAGSTLTVDLCTSGTLTTTFDTLLWLGTDCPSTNVASFGCQAFNDDSSDSDCSGGRSRVRITLPTDRQTFYVVAAAKNSTINYSSAKLAWQTSLSPTPTPTSTVSPTTSASTSGSPSSSSGTSPTSSGSVTRSASLSNSPSATPSATSSGTGSASGTRTSTPSVTADYCTGLPGAVSTTYLRRGTPALSGNVTSNNLGASMTSYFSANMSLCGAWTGTRRLLPAVLDLGQVAPPGTRLTVDTCWSGTSTAAYDTMLWLGLGCPADAASFNCVAANDNSTDADCPLGRSRVAVTLTSPLQGFYIVAATGIPGTNNVNVIIHWNADIPTPTSSASLSSTVTPSSTSPTSVSSSPSASVTHGASASSTPSASASHSAVPTPTSTASGTATDTATASPSSTTTRSGTGTATGTVSGTPSATPNFCTGLPGGTGTYLRRGTPALSGNITSTNLGSSMTNYFVANYAVCGSGAVSSRRLLPAVLDLGQVAPPGTTLTVDTCYSGVRTAAYDTVLWLGLGCPLDGATFNCVAANDNSTDADCPLGRSRVTLTLTSPLQGFYVVAGSALSTVNNVNVVIHWSAMLPSSTSTPTTAPSGSASGSGSPSASGTRAVSGSATGSGTVTGSGSTTSSSTPSRTPSASTSLSSTGSGAATGTPTVSLSLSAAATKSSTSSASWTSSGTSAPTGTVTPTSTQSATPTPTAAVTHSPTLTSSTSATSSSTRSRSSSPSASASNSSSASPTRSASSTRSAHVTITSTGTSTPQATTSTTPTRTRTGSSSPSGSGSTSSTPEPSVTGTGTLTVTATASPSQLPSPPAASASPTRSSPLSLPSSSPTTTKTATRPPSVSHTSTRSGTVTRSPTRSRTATRSATRTPSHTRTASPSKSGSRSRSHSHSRTSSKKKKL